MSMTTMQNRDQSPFPRGVQLVQLHQLCLLTLHGPSSQLSCGARLAAN